MTFFHYCIISNLKCWVYIEVCQCCSWEPPTNLKMTIICELYTANENWSFTVTCWGGKLVCTEGFSCKLRSIFSKEIIGHKETCHMSYVKWLELRNEHCIEKNHHSICFSYIPIYQYLNMNSFICKHVLSLFDSIRK